ncbi:ribonuclease D [Nocardia sp. NPDC058497]|uniref:ribonuclease D n=1 Tax=Nocardia sp. NPDC058497 TaxID=3346529 RepID=UPI003662F45F
MKRVSSTSLFDLDLDERFLSLCRTARQVAWDIETSGLDWKKDRIATCQVAAQGEVAVVRFGDNLGRPTRLARLLEDPTVVKVFHHAPFDLRFMGFQWLVSPRSVACTKIASKILEPGLDSGDHSLMQVLNRRLGIQISKEQQRSDWFAEQLTAAQLEYAAEDVRHLAALFEDEIGEAKRRGLDGLLQRCFDFLPSRVELDILGAGDVYAY